MSLTDRERGELAAATYMIHAAIAAAGELTRDTSLDDVRPDKHPTAGVDIDRLDARLDVKLALGEIAGIADRLRDRYL